MTSGDKTRRFTEAEAAQRAAFNDSDGELQRAARRRFAEQNPAPDELVTFRLTTILKRELEQAAVASNRTLSGEIRYRLGRGLDAPRMLEETLNAIRAAVKAGISGEQLDRLIDIHMEGLRR